MEKNKIFKRHFYRRTDTLIFDINDLLQSFGFDRHPVNETDAGTQKVNDWLQREKKIQGFIEHFGDGVFVGYQAPDTAIRTYLVDLDYPFPRGAFLRALRRVKYHEVQQLA